MNLKQSFIDALQHRPDICPVPVWELEFHLWDKFGQGRFVVGTDFMRLTSAEKEKALYSNADTVARVCDLLHFAAVTVPGGYWEVSPGHPAYYWLPDEYRFRQARLLKERIGENVALVANTGGVLAMPEGHNYVDFSIQLMESPHEIEALARLVYLGSLDKINRFSDIGMDVVLTASDLADGHGLFFSPDQLDYLIFPFLSKWVEAVHAKKMYSILHTDGNINTALDGIVNSGVDGLQAIDSTAGMDILNIQKKYHAELCVCGNVDCGLLITGCPDQIFDSVTRLLESAQPRGSFALGASNALQADTSPENYLALVSAWEQFDRKIVESIKNRI